MSPEQINLEKKNSKVVFSVKKLLCHSKLKMALNILLTKKKDCKM